MTAYGLTNSLMEVDNEKLGELHMRLKMLLAIPVKKVKQKEKNQLKTTGG